MIRAHASIHLMIETALVRLHTKATMDNVSFCLSDRACRVTFVLWNSTWANTTLSATNFGREARQECHEEQGEERANQEEKGRREGGGGGSPGPGREE